jgi:dienelactone hydrolase
VLEKLAIPSAARVVAAPQIEAGFEDAAIRYERWSIPARRGVVPAWFLRPRSAGAACPAVVALHPHGRQFEIAKSWVAGLVGDPSRAYGKQAALAGFCVLAPDLAGFEDHRPPLQERKASYALQGEAYERLLANQATVQGATLQGYIVDDLLHCVDALAADKQVDARRIACLGHSYGGQETLFAMLADERIRAGVVSCGFSMISELVARNISHNMALYVPGLLPQGDMDALLPALAPRALRVLAGRSDPIYPVEGVRQVEVAARRAWAEHQAADRLQFCYFDGDHDLPAAELTAALGWLQEIMQEMLS